MDLQSSNFGVAVCKGILFVVFMEAIVLAIAFTSLFVYGDRLLPSIALGFLALLNIHFARVIYISVWQLEWLARLFPDELAEFMRILIKFKEYQSPVDGELKAMAIAKMRKVVQEYDAASSDKPLQQN